MSNVTAARQQPGGLVELVTEHGEYGISGAYLADARRPWSDGAVQIDLGPLGVNCYYSRQ